MAVQSTRLVSAFISLRSDVVTCSVLAEEKLQLSPLSLEPTRFTWNSSLEKFTELSEEYTHAFLFAEVLFYLARSFSRG